MRNRYLQAAGLAGVGMLTLASAPVKAQMTSAGTWWNAANYQSGPTTVTPNGGFFGIGATETNATDFNGGLAMYPGPNSPDVLFPSGFPLNFFNGQPGFATVAAMNAAYPFGSYAITLTNSVTFASQTEVVSYKTNYATSDTPQLTAASFNALNGLSTGLNSLTVNFNSFTPVYVPSDPNDAFTFFTIWSASTGTTAAGCGFLAPSSTSCTIDPNAELSAGTTYNWELDFSTRDYVYNSSTSVYDYTNFDVRTDGSFTTAVSGVPEPSSWAMLVVGLAGLGYLGKRRRVIAGATA